ncbi:MAG: diacylglycerol kinase [bacterium]
MISRHKQFRVSLSYAWDGLRRVFGEEQNFRVQSVVGLLVILVMFLLEVSSMEKAILTLAVAFILVLELMNSIFERVTDLLKPRVHMRVKDVKDIMAGTVLLASVAASLVGLFILGPHILSKLFG